MAEVASRRTDRERAIAVIVLAKAPIPGAAKTRLVPRLGAHGAARLHAALVERTLETVRRAGLGRIELCCSPDATHPFFAACARRYGVALTVQSPGDLGARMLAALDRVVAVAGRALLVGTDCPALAPAHLQEAAAALAAGHDAVLGPAEDGGYVLVGLARAAPEVFAGIRWGGREVLRDTRARLAGLGWRWHELGELWDIDRPADLARFAGRIAGGADDIAAALRVRT